MDNEKRLTLVMMVALVVLVGMLLVWRYAIQPGLRRRAEEERRGAREVGVTEVETQAVGLVRAATGEGRDATRAEGRAAGEAGVVGGAALAGEQAAGAGVSQVREVNLLRNSDFSEGLQGWLPWPPGTRLTNHIRVVKAEGIPGVSNALRIEGEGGELVGMQQVVRLETGRVYRLRAQVRSVLTNDSTVMFGGRVACYMAGRPEVQLVWMSEYRHWWPKEVVFTNADFDGVGVVYAHMGYGKFASTGEFTDIRLEELR